MMVRTLRTRCLRNVVTGSRNIELFIMVNHLPTLPSSMKDSMSRSLYRLRRRKKKRLEDEEKAKEKEKKKKDKKKGKKKKKKKDDSEKGPQVAKFGPTEVI